MAANSLAMPLPNDEVLTGVENLARKLFTPIQIGPLGLRSASSGIRLVSRHDGDQREQGQGQAVVEWWIPRNSVITLRICAETGLRSRLHQAR